MTGTGSASRCVGSIATAGDFPGLCLQDGPLGVRLADLTTVFPTGINTAATYVLGAYCTIPIADVGTTIDG